MTAAVLATKSLKIASGMCILSERDPLATAKAISSIDYLSGGRVIFGVGAGWHSTEMRNHGTSFANRYSIVRERVLAIQKIWSCERAEFHGRYVDFEEIWTHPRPAQVPRPPIIAGFDGSVGMKNMIEWADGWCPTHISFGALREKFAGVRRDLELAGRGSAPFSLSVFYYPYWMAREVDEDAVSRLADIGVERVILNLPPEPMAIVSPVLDRYADLLG
jgi:probable F420-dependent oxidoreductase